MSTEVVRSPQIMVHRRSPKHVEEGSGLVQPIWTTCLEEIVRYVASARIRKVRKENVTTLLHVFWKHGIEVQAEFKKERLHNRGCEPSFRSVHLSLSRSWCVVGGYTPCLKEYVEEGNLIPDRLECQTHVQRVIACDKLGPIRRMLYSFAFNAGNEEGWSVLREARVLLLFSLSSEI